MKVCHLTSVHQRYDTRIFLKECTSLANAGYDVSLVVADGNGDEEKNGVKIYDVGKPSGRKERMLKTTKKVYQKALELDCDVYHFHDPELIQTSLKLRKKGKKVIYDVHEDLPRQILTKDYLPGIIRKSLAPVVELWENNAAKKFSHIITSTDFIRDRFYKVNPNSSAVKNYPILKELLITADWNERKPEVCYIGGITEPRGIVEIVRALEKTDTVLHLAGKFDSKATEEKVRKMPGWKKVKFYGFVDREQIKQILSSVQVGLVTLQPKINYLDSLPIKMFEYMAAGIPVVASNFPLWKKIVEQSKCGICVDPLNTDQIAEAINFLLNNPEEAKKMGDNGQKAAKEKYNWTIEERKLLSIYNKLKDQQ